MSTIPGCIQTSNGSGNFIGYYNSLGQSPCYIATALGNACNVGGSVFTLPPLVNQNDYLWYPGPSVADASNPCLCSTVYFSLLSACSICQGFVENSWVDHCHNCTTAAISVSSFPKPIPAGTSVPHYAYLNVTASDDWFDEEYALIVGGAESSPIPSISSATSTVNTETRTMARTTSAIITSTGSDSTKGRSAILIRAMVGLGVGFLLLILVLGLVWFCKFRRGRATPVQNSPPEQSLQIVNQHSRQSGGEYSLLSAKQYSLLAPPLQPSPMPLETRLGRMSNWWIQFKELKEIGCMLTS